MGQRFGLVVGRGPRDGGYKFEFRINEALLPLVEFAEFNVRQADVGLQFQRLDLP